MKALNRPRADIRFSFEKEILVPAGTVGWRGPELDSWEETMVTVEERDVLDPASQSPLISEGFPLLLAYDLDLRPISYHNRYN